MKSEIFYMLGVVGVVFAVNFLLRAFPFIVFGGQGKRLPQWVAKVSDFISPVIIGCLLIYAFSSMQWKSAGFYAAVVAVTALHLWRRNALLSIVTGTLIYMCLLNCGCTTRTIGLDSENTSISVSVEGVRFDGRPVRPAQVPELLKEYGIDNRRVIHIFLEREVKNLSEARLLMACLAKAGYTRPVLVTKRHAESFNVGRKRKDIKKAR